MDCSTPFGATRAYETLFLSTGIHHDNRENMITLEMFTKGFHVLGFDLTTDKDADEEHTRLPRQGNVRIEARFKKKNHYQNPLLAFSMNSLDKLKSTTLETLQ